MPQRTARKELSSERGIVIGKSTIGLETAKIMRTGIFRISTIAILMNFVMIPIPGIQCATYQLKSKKQGYYPKKEFLFTHPYHPFLFHVNIIIGFPGFKPEDLMLHREKGGDADGGHL